MQSRGSASVLGLEVVDQIGAMLAYWDNNQVCRFANKAYVEWFGKSPDEMVDKITMKELLGSLYEKNIPFIQGALAGKPQVFERAIPIPSGEIRYFLASYYPDIDQGKVKGFFAHVADITKYKMLEIELKASELKFRGLLESAPDCVIIVNSQGIIQLLNAQCEKMFGYSKKELLGQGIEMLMPKRFQQPYSERRTSFFGHPTARPMGNERAMLGLRKNGEEFPVEVSLSPLETEEDFLVSAAVRDVSRKVEKEKELARSYEIISNQNQRLMNFSYTIAHNLRSHSTNLELLVQLLTQAQTDEEMAPLLAFLQQTSLRFSETVSHLNEIVEAQSQLNVAKVNINLRQYIEKCLVLLQPNIQSTRALIHNRVAAETAFAYNPAYLESILFNLLSNAIKYRHPDRAPEIILEATNTRNTLLLKISDNGLGINLKRHGSSLFGMYKTFHGNEDAKGLGLFITNYQVEALGGHIEVESKEGTGTTFSIHFLLQEKD